MDCNRIKELIYPFLDSQLDTQTSELVKEHLSFCPICRLELEQEKKIGYLIKSGIPQEKAPYELKEAILSQIKKLEERKVNPFTPPFLKLILATSAAAFLVVTLIYFLLININKPFPVFSASIKDHTQFIQGNLSLDIASHKSEEIRNWLQTKLDFKVMVPNLSGQGVNLLGARICTLKNKKVAYLMYGKDGHKLSVFMFDAKGLKFPKARKVAVNDKNFFLSEEKGYKSALWIEEGIACVFVSNLSEAELLNLAS